MLMGVTAQYSLIFTFECFIDHTWANLDRNWEKKIATRKVYLNYLLRENLESLRQISKDNYDKNFIAW